MQFDQHGAPDPFDWLVRRWIAMAEDGRIKPGSESERAEKAEALAFQLIPYLKPKLKAVDVTIDAVEPIKVVIGGDG